MIKFSEFMKEEAGCACGCKGDAEKCSCASSCECRTKKDIQETDEEIVSEATDTDNFVKDIIKLKNSNKNKWYTYIGEVDGMKVKIKGNGTWLQIFNVDGVEFGTPDEVSVKEFKELLAEPF